MPNWERAHEGDTPDRPSRPEQELPGQRPEPIEGSVEETSEDQPKAKLAFENSVDAAVAERKAADAEASAEADRPDWRSAEWRATEPELRAAWRAHEERWARTEGDQPGRLRDLARLFGRGGVDGGPPDGHDQPTKQTWLETDTRPPPVDTTRAYHRTGYLDPPLPREQESLDRTVPRDDNGDPARFLNPKEQWSSEVNGDGPNKNVFRRNNCLDCSLSAISTWHGEPKVSAPRHAEYQPNGDPSLAGEAGGPQRAERWLGHEYESIGPDASAYNEIARRLTDAGHGAGAAIIGWWDRAHRRGHAWNAFNYQGEVYWVDTQDGSVSERPLGRQAVDIKAVIMDSEGKKA